MTSTVTFTIPPDSSPQDPTTITCSFKIGSGTPTVWVYGVNGNIQKTAAGIYFVELDTTNLPGVWTVQWRGSGGGPLAIDVDTFTVTALAIP